MIKQASSFFMLKTRINPTKPAAELAQSVALAGGIVRAFYEGIKVSFPLVNFHRAELHSLADYRRLGSLLAEHVDGSKGLRRRQAMHPCHELLTLVL